jgi:L-threonylcarbamoyladenylate synthase
MKLFTTVNDPEIVRQLTAGKVGIIRTDTLYGLVGRADDEAAVERIYEIKGRDHTKSPIVLIASSNQLFDTPDTELLNYVDTVWPGPVSVIFPSVNAPTWIRRGNNSVAYRQPNKPDLLALLAQTGPLIAPSANPESLPPAMDIKEAKSYFGNSVDFYVDEGRVDNVAPSQLLRVYNGKVERLR